MNKGLAKFLAIGFVIFMLIEIFGNMVVQNSKEKKEIEDQFENYELKNYTAEEEEELVSRLYPDVDDTTFTENMMYAFSQSILLAKSMDNYDIFANNVSDEYLQDLLYNEEQTKPGEIIYSFLTKNMTPTRSSAVLKGNEGEVLIYLVEINTLEKRNPLQYEFSISNKKITSIKESE